MSFNAESTGVYNGCYFGFEFTYDESKLALMSVQWDATVSYRDGSSGAPEAIIEASTQIEIFDAQYPDVWQQGIYTKEIDSEILAKNSDARKAATVVIEHIEEGGDENDKEIASELAYVNNASEWLNERVYNSALEDLNQGKIVGLVGGDHSTPLGLIQAIATKHPEFGVLHIDAHMDLRDGYEGFAYSHASIMRHVSALPEVRRLTQVGVRDYCQGELEYAKGNNKIIQFTDLQLFEAKAEGVCWAQLCEKIVNSLPRKVYISLDIDGLDRAFCPSTGTPVPGGLSFNEMVYLLGMVVRSGREIIGFDLNEVCPNQDDEWDAIVGARLLYKLCGATLKSNIRPLQGGEI